MQIISNLKTYNYFAFFAILNFFALFFIITNCNANYLNNSKLETKKFYPQLQQMALFSLNEGTAFGKKYNKKNLFSFNEHIIDKKNSLGLVFNLAKIDSEYHNLSRFALFSPELFYRHKFWSYKKFGLILHNAIKFPNIYNEEKHLGLMPKNDQFDYEIRLIQLYNFNDRLVGNVVHGLSDYFFRSEIAYRNRINNPFNEIRFASWLGYKLSPKIHLLAQDNIFWNIDNYNHNHLNNSFKNFQIDKQANNIASLSLLYNLNDENSMQLGYSRRVMGNNPFYDNSSVIIGIWHSFKS